MVLKNNVCLSPQPQNMLMLCLNFKKSQPRYAYKRYAYKQKRVYFNHATGYVYLFHM